MTHSLSSKATGEIWAHQRDYRVPETRGEIYQLVKCRTEYEGKGELPPREPDKPHVDRNPERTARAARLRRNLELIKRGIEAKRATQRRARGIKPPQPDEAVLQPWQRRNRVYVGTPSQIDRPDSETRTYLCRLAIGLQPLAALGKHRDDVHRIFGMSCVDLVRAIEDGQVTF